MFGSRAATAQLAGALASKVAPALVQLTLLSIVAQRAGVEDVGLLALASATAFMCGSLGELGFGASLAASGSYFGTSNPPIKATRRLRLSGAAVGALVYISLWGLGLGSHDVRLLILTPLPFLLSLSYGLAGAMNAHGLLGREGAVTFIESLVIAAGALYAMPGEPLTGALVALVAARVLGLLLRWRIVAAQPSEAIAHVPGLLRVQSGFLAATVVIVFHGQADVLLLGFLGNVVLVGTWAPLLRLAYGVLLAAEAVSWALLGRLGDEGRTGKNERPLLIRHWRAVGMGLGLLAGACFVATASPVIRVALGTDYVPQTAVIVLLGATIPIRCVAFIRSVDIIRGGVQERRLPVLAVSAVVLLAGAALAAAAESLVLLAAARLTAEAVLATGYVWVLHGLTRGGISRQVFEPA